LLNNRLLNNRLPKKEKPMSSRDHAPLGSPCWADLWTSDVDGSRAFYSEIFGWEAQEADPEFGGYFMFTRDGVHGRRHGRHG
jgi:predicted enzyme related to lactoylglutathione lyase